MLRGRGFSMRAMLMERIVLSNKVQKMAGVITKAGRGIVRLVSGAGDQKIRAPTETDALFTIGLEPMAFCHLLSAIQCSAGLRSQKSTPFWSD